MSYFATALVALFAAELLMAAGFGYPATALQGPDTLVLVHLAAIGWLSLLMCGALFQFVPVLVAKPLYSNTLPLPTLVALVGGLALLLGGFLQLGGRLGTALPFLPLAALLLAIGFGLAIWNLGRTLWQARPLPLPARFVLIGLFGLAATVLLGSVFALVLGGSVSVTHLTEVTALGVPIHAVAGLGGWLTLCAMGVSYRLLAMFMLAPEPGTTRTRVALHSGTAALVLAVVGGLAAICLDMSRDLALALAGLPALGALGFYGADIAHMYRARRRRHIELKSRMATFALASLAASVVLMLVAIALGLPDSAIAATVFLVAFGWLSGLGLAKLYKIVAFLTWLECYGPVLGKAPTPRVQDLVAETRARPWFWLYFAAVWCGALALTLDAGLVVRGAAGAMALATIGIVAELVTSRRLVNVKHELRLPAGATRPRLLICASSHA
jgi:hypothetical protein